MSQAILTNAGPRNRAMDVMRLVLASMVLAGHAPEMVSQTQGRDWLYPLTHYSAGGISIGGIAVNGFFLLSGYLITRSWQEDPELLNFLFKRGLRILPGIIVAVAVLYIATELLVPPAPRAILYVWTHPHHVGTLLSPPASPRMAVRTGNGSLWTIPYEIRCYLMIAVLGMVGLLRRRYICLGLTLLLLLGQAVPGIERHFDWQFSTLGGEGENLFRLHGAFLAGACFYLFRDAIPYRPAYAVVAAICFAAFSFTPYLQTSIAIFGGYLMFYAAQRKPNRSSRLGRFPDISYGVYLYGWPIENFVISFLHTSALATLLVSLPIDLLAGWVSWHAVERPMLKLKRRSTAQLPAG